MSQRLVRVSPEELAAINAVLVRCDNTDTLLDDATSARAPVQELAESSEERSERRRAALTSAANAYGKNLASVCEGTLDAVRFNTLVRCAQPCPHTLSS